MKLNQSLIAAAITLSAFSAHALDIVTDPPYGVDLTPLLAPIWENPNTANVFPKTVSLLPVMNSTSWSISIYGIGAYTFTGSKTNGNGVTTLDTWYGTAPGGATATLLRDGVKLVGNLQLTPDQVVRVYRLNAQGHGAVQIMKLPAQKTWYIIEAEE